jgi:ABC-type branched-subunit amino acid transport system permease subunit
MSWESVERHFDRIALVAFLISALAMALLDRSADPSTLRGWPLRLARDAGLATAASLLLVFGIRSLRRSGVSRFSVATTATGALIFVGFAGMGVYGTHGTGLSGESLLGLQRTIAFWSVSGVVCAGLGLLSPIRPERGES